MKYKNIKVKMPNGENRIGQLLSQTNNGYRSVQVNYNGSRLTGRVTSRHGFKDGRTLDFECKAKDVMKLYPGDTFVQMS